MRSGRRRRRGRASSTPHTGRRHRVDRAPSVEQPEVRSPQTEYFALLWDGDDLARPRTILRRRPAPGTWEEEILLGDGTWERTGVLALVRLNMFEDDVQPISTEAALEFERTVR